MHQLTGAAEHPRPWHPSDASGAAMMTGERRVIEESA